MKKEISVFGLGRMGGQIARRLHKNKFNVYVWNRSEGPVKEFKKFGGFGSQNIEEVVDKLDTSPASPRLRRARIFWLMLPHAIVDDFLFGKNHLGPFLKRGDIVVDGGNSFY